MSRLINLFFDIFGPRDWSLTLDRQRWYRRRNGQWEYSPLTEEDEEEVEAWFSHH